VKVVKTESYSGGGEAVARALPVDELRAVCTEDVGCGSTQELAPLEGIVGQDRALKALEFGLGIEDPRFNIYVAGESGTGRSTAVSEFLGQIALKKPVPSDWCYVHNFKDSYQPRAIRVAPGQGIRLAREVAAVVEAARKEIPRVFESEQYTRLMEQTLHTHTHRREQIVGAINAKASQDGFAIEATPVGLVVIPLIKGRPMTDQEYAALTADVRQRIDANREQLESQLLEVTREIRKIERDAAAAVEELDRSTALATIGHLFDQVKKMFPDNQDVAGHLDDMKEDMLQNIRELRGQPAARPDGSPAAMPAWVKDVPFRRYAVNMFVDNSALKGAPVVMELNPTYNNLFGRIEKEAQLGVLVTDLTLVRPGSLHQANGGYIVLPVEELLRNPLAYEGLKRAMRTREIVIEEAGEKLGVMVTKTLRPQAIPLDIKVILIGTPYIYQQLYALDPDFNELFKVKAEFDTTMERTPENIKNYALLLCKLSVKENLRHLDAKAIEKIVEFSSRLAEDQTKLSTRFAEIADMIREASFYATQEGSALVEDTHVKRAIEAKTYRSNLVESRLQEMIARGILKISTSGAAVGEINGLSVLSLGDFMFGKPSRITASVTLGREGIVDIERAVSLGGPLHSKGVMILGGCLAHKYAKDMPLSLSSRLVFEQSYGLIDGDSASSAELYALLSALSGLPIKRGFAVTGSVNQWGEVQAIGGVNEKIEGFFEVCKIHGLTREQGVIIPESNVRHLMLKEQVVETVSKGGFHIWAVSTIDEGIEILTGVSAGTMQPDGSYPEGTVNHLVQQRLRQMAEQLRRFSPAMTT
jgi:lon-related putative ATP-dependent protease